MGWSKLINIFQINIWVGRAISWLALALVLTQFAVVVLRYVFSTGSIGLQESVWYMHGLLFLLGAGFTLATDDHVRLDVIYRKTSERGRAWINLIGSLFLLLPFCGAMIWFSMSFVSSSWAVREGSPEVSGLPFLWLLKTSLIAFAVLLGIQALVTIVQCLSVLKTRNDI